MIAKGCQKKNPDPQGDCDAYPRWPISLSERFIRRLKFRIYIRLQKLTKFVHRGFYIAIWVLLLKGHNKMVRGFSSSL
jgi:hypothetical protein